jgi:HPt (histidine-containing phosphotransfer) domain-containing protein
MDRYLAKPLSIRALEASLTACFAARPGTVACAGTEANGPVPEAAKDFDRDDLLQRFDGDKTLARNVISTFTREVPAEIRKLEQAAAGRNAKELAALAHKVRGAAASASAPALAEICLTIERSAAAGLESAFANAAHVTPAFAAAAELMREEPEDEHVAVNRAS